LTKEDMSKEQQQISLAAAIRAGQFRDGLAAVVGQHPTGIDRSRKLILELNQIDPIDMASLHEWCAEPMPELPIIPDHRGVLEDLAAHEFGHLIAARALGFKTGDVSLVLNSLDGSHTGSLRFSQMN
jgi:hypothetical protein